jgi:hypothetical protein
MQVKRRHTKQACSSEHVTDVSSSKIAVYSKSKGAERVRGVRPGHSDKLASEDEETYPAGLSN